MAVAGGDDVGAGGNGHCDNLVVVWIGDDHGWVDLDPTNNLLVSDEHVTLAWGRDFQDVSPLRGIILGGGRHALRVNVDLDPVLT